MGLAGPKKNTKISADPRNTHWASDTSRFGHRLLSQYGWTPGSVLGDTTSAHHAHLTSASSSGIKVMIKDDNLGIGAKKGSQDHECTGLDVFQGLLGRLNGKSDEEVEREEEARRRGKKEIWVGERYRMRFVLGRVYKSSDIDKLVEMQKGLKNEEEEREVKLEHRAERAGREKEEKGDKAAAELDAKEEEGSGRRQSSSEKLERKSKKRKIKVEEDADKDDDDRWERKKKPKAEKEVENTKKKREKKGRRKHKEKISESSGSSTPSASGESVTSSRLKKSKKNPKDDSDQLESKPKIETEEKRKKDKKAKKEKKEKKKRKVEVRKSSTEVTEESESKSRTEEKGGREVDTTSGSGAAVKAVERVLTGRRAIRYRYIAAKRSAVMDAKSLNEIFMIKA
ncbi:hypothetical protein BDZ91DRAFT_776852 [Kalaharituber pfeilii]|nr:hypothetical protein BDZ91DRAFT_776852 [Kalaharituber pfeilii]